MEGDSEALIPTGSGNRFWSDHHLWWARPLVVFFSTYAVFPVIGFLEQEHGAVQRSLGLALVALYVALYIRVMWRGLARPFQNQSPQTLSAMTVVAVPLVLVTGRPGGDLALYWLLAGYTLSLRRRWWFPILGAALATEFLALLIGTGLSWTAIGVSLLRTVGYAVLLMGFYQLVYLLIELSEARAALARHAVTEERLRFARDLHDLLGQRLSAAALRAELASHLTERDPAQASIEALAAADLARDGLAEVREAVSGYRKMTVTGELDTAAPLLSAAGIELEATTPDVPLASGIDELGAWVIREGVTNVVRHANAKTCWVTIADGSPLVVQVSDDGRGAERGWGNGLTGLADRLHRAGARLTTSEDGKRFHLRAEFPEAVSP